jgi:hypothetical protein
MVTVGADKSGNTSTFILFATKTPITQIIAAPISTNRRFSKEMVNILVSTLL